MTDPSQNCPSAWDERTESGKRLCFRQPNSPPGCDSVTFSTNGKEYTHVCGRAIGYQYAHPDAFGLVEAPGTIDNHYVDGLSVTHGQPGKRTHIWTFAAGLDEQLDDLQFVANLCPCLNPDNIASVPSYVAANYFCESGVPYPDVFSFDTFYPDDPLWDGDGCGAPNNNCCSFNSPPWFTVELPTATTDDIEVRNCADENSTGDNTDDEDVGIELIEHTVNELIKCELQILNIAWTVVSPLFRSATSPCVTCYHYVYKPWLCNFLGTFCMCATSRSFQIQCDLTRGESGRVNLTRGKSQRVNLTRGKSWRVNLTRGKSWRVSFNKMEVSIVSISAFTFL